MASRINTDNGDNHNKKNKMYGKGKIGASLAIASLLVSSLFTIAGNMAQQSAIAVTAVPAGFSTNNDFTNPPNPQIAVEGSDILVVWQGFDSDSGTNNVTFAKSSDGGASFDVQVFDSAPDSLANPPAPQVAIDGSNVYFVWLQNSTIVLATSEDSGASFDASTIVEADDLANPQIAVNGSNIYIVWQDEGDILLAKSSDGGSAFNITTVNAGDSSNPQIAVDSSSGNVFVVWQANEDIFLAKSDDTGANFDTDNLNSTSEASTLPDVSVSGDNVVVAWQEIDPEVTPPANDIFLATSEDGGADFDIRNLSNSPQESSSPSIGSTSDGSSVFVIWEEFSFVTLAGEMFVVASTDGGATLGCPTKVGSTADDAANPGVAAADDSGTVYAVWEGVNLDTFASDIAFTDNLEYQATTVGIQIDSDNPDTDFDGVVESRWGLESDAVTVSGAIANAEEDDTIIVDWGDGVSSDTSTISLSSCSWNPVSHVYDSEAAALGINSITASLLDGGTGDVKATTIIPISVAVRAHTTSLDLDPIPSVVQGNNVTVSGLLVDTDAEEPIGGASIILDGSGTDAGLSAISVVTDADGSFAATAASPSEAASAWLVQAHFTGDLLYQPFDSEIQSYSTVSVNATEFPVSSTGENVSVSLSGFGATLEFGNIDSLGGGIVYVTSCNATDTGRFAVLDSDGGSSDQGTCLEISPAVQLAADSTSTLTMTYDNSTLPDDGSDIDMFHEQDAGAATYFDITTSRNLDAETVTGEVTSFGRFIVAAAIHSEKLPSEVRQQIFVGDDNIIELRDVDDPANETADISLDESAYQLTDTATITIIDNNANLDPAVIDTVSAGITSVTSGPNGGINVTLAETSSDTGTFTATFTFTTGNSSGTALEVATGDSLSVSYQQTLGGRLKAVIDGVVETGVVDLSDFQVQEDSTPFSPLGYAVNLELVDASLDPITGVLTITMSYANADLAGSDETYIRMFQGENLGDGTANWNSDPITETDSVTGFTIGLDADAKTITAETSSAGVFLLGYDIGSPGGAGGGLGGFGSGLVVDLVASLAQPSSGGGGGGGGGSTSSQNDAIDAGQNSESAAILSGQDVISAIDISDGGTVQNVQLRFENVTTTGMITVQENQPAEFSQLFSSVQSTGISSSPSVGLLVVDGSDSQTIGNVVDIEPSSELTFDGAVYVTVPYDESLVLGSGLSEDDIRLMNHNGTRWEDTTISIDQDANTVSGVISSLSPVTVAVMEDGTFGASYIEANPLSALKVSGASFLDEQVEDARSSVPVDDQVAVGMTLKNVQRTSQPYAFIVQVVDAQGNAVSINWITGQLDKGETTDLSTSWTPIEPGDYLVTMFVWSQESGSEAPTIPLSPKESLAILHVTGSADEGETSAS